MVGLRNEFGRGILRGATDFSLLHPEWSLLTFEENQILSPRFCERYNIHGLIVHVRSNEIYQAAINCRCPFVNVSNRQFPAQAPTVTSDDLAVGTLVVDYFIRKRFRRLAFFGQEGKLSFKQRFNGFRERAALQGLSVHQFWAPKTDPEAYYTPGQERRIVEWLRSLPTPVGILAASDRFALTLIDQCVQHNLRVPDSYAIVGVDNDLMKCRMSRIPFSSVELGVEMIGFRAAKLLADNSFPTEPIYIPPVRVVERASSEHFSVDDPLVAKALDYIRNNLGRAVDVSELAAIVHVSRRTLERRWRNSFGSSPQSEIRRLKAEMARNLLLDTSLSCKEIATAVGLPDGRSLTILCQAASGKTPTEIRQQGKTDAPATTPPKQAFALPGL